MPDNNNMILEFPLNGIQLDLGTTATFDDISGYLNTGRLEGNFPADRTSFDNTDTDLESTDTESAIKEVNTKANTKADAQAVSQAFEGVERALATKADAEATSQALATKADKADTYTKSEVDNALGNKADKSDTYTKSQVDTLIDNLPEPMIFKGTLGVGGTIQSLPTASADNEGWTFKCITAGTYSGLTLKVGDTVTCFNPPNTSIYEWDKTGSQDTDTDTWRAIKVNGVEKLGNGISSGNVDLVDTTNVKAHFEGDGNKVSFTLDGIDTSAQVDEKVAGLIDDETASEDKVFSSSKVTELVNAKPSIDDTTEATDKVWSSKKTFDEIFNILPTGNASGSIANFNTSLALPLEIEAEFGAGAGGVSAVNVIHCGANLFDKATKVINGYYITDATGDLVSSPTSKCTDYIPIKGGLQYKFLTEQTSGGWGAWYDENKRFISGVSGYSDSRYNVKTAPANACYVRLTMVYLNNGNVDTFAVNYPSTDTDYHAYNGSTTLINLGGTYYNGGKITIDKDGHRKLTADGQTIDLTDGEPITALVGTNNVYGNTGDIEVTYKKSIDDAIAELQALILNA